jgi:tellurite resistance protein TehA-like permease
MEIRKFTYFSSFFGLFFLENRCLCQVISKYQAGNCLVVASYLTGVLFNCSYIVIRLFFVYKSNNNRITDEDELSKRHGEYEITTRLPRD